MTKLLYFFFFAIILFTSCKEDEVPQSFLSGTYEVAGENTDTGIWYVQQYVFKADGSYENLSLVRASQNGDDLGYHGYSTGAYSLRGEDFSLKMTEASTLDYDEFPKGYAESLEDLEPQELSEEFIESKGVLRNLENGDKISILFECNDMLASSLAMCIGELVYARVD